MSMIMDAAGQPENTHDGTTRNGSVKRVVLAYSGGLDTSAIIPWLKENYGCEVIAFVGDVGQGDEELEGVEEKAMKSGASGCHVCDLKESFVNEYIWPSLKTGATYENGYLLGTALARPILAKAQISVARKVNADAVAHGCTGKGNDQIRFEAAYAALAPDLSIIAPWREWSMTSREELLGYLQEKNIPCSASLKKIYSRDANAWHISHEGGMLENPWNMPDEDVWTWTMSPLNAPDQPVNIELMFEKGVLTGINGENYSAFSGLNRLNHIAATHGVGRLDIVENRLVGMKSRGCYETPGGTVIMTALKSLETLVLDRETLALREQFGTQFAKMLYDGKWFTTASQVILNAASEIASVMTGKVIVRLYKGQVTAVAMQSPFSLYSESFATFEDDDVYAQSDAAGFSRLHSLSSRIKAMKNRQNKSSFVGHNVKEEVQS